MSSGCCRRERHLRMPVKHICFRKHSRAKIQKIRNRSIFVKLFLRHRLSTRIRCSHWCLVVRAYESGKKKLRIKKYPDTRGTGRESHSVKHARRGTDEDSISRLQWRSYSYVLLCNCSAKTHYFSQLVSRSFISGYHVCSHLASVPRQWG